MRSYAKEQQGKSRNKVCNTQEMKFGRGRGYHHSFTSLKLESAALCEKLIHERSLAVVHVCNDSYIADPLVKTSLVVGVDITSRSTVEAILRK